MSQYALQWELIPVHTSIAYATISIINNYWY